MQARFAGDLADPRDEVLARHGRGFSQQFAEGRQRLLARQRCQRHGAAQVDAIFLECVGLQESVLTALQIARPGGCVGRVGVRQAASIPVAPTFWKNVQVAADRPRPARTPRAAG